MLNDNLLKSYDKVPFILVKDSIVIGMNHQFNDTTEFTYDELINRNIKEIFRALRVGPNVDIDIIDERTDYFLFTQSLEVKFINIRVINLKEETAYIFLERPDLNLDMKFPFLNVLFLDNCCGVGIYSMPDKTLLKANEKYISVFDEPYNKKENCIGRLPVEFEPNFIGSTFEEIWNRVLETGESFNMDECMYEGLSKGITYWRISIHPIFEKNNIKYFVIMNTEITKEVLSRKKLEEQANIIEQKNRQLKEQKEQLEAIINNMSDSLMVFDKYGRYILKNKVAIDKMNSSLYNNVGDSYKRELYFDLEGNELAVDSIPAMRVLNGESIREQILCVRTSEGDKYIGVSGSPIYDDTGDFLMGIVCTRDITESEIQNQIINQQRIQFETIMNNMGELLLVTDSKGSYIYINKCAEKYFFQENLKNLGTDRCSIQLMDIQRRYISKEDLPYKTVLRRKEIDKRVVIVKKEEQEIYLQTTTVPVFDSKGDVDIIISIATDVTGHIKHSKIIQRQKEELETIVENMSEGLAVIDKNGKYVRVNKKVEEHTQKSTKLGKVMNSVGESFDMGERYYDMSGKLLSRDDFPSVKILRGEKIENERVVVKRGDITYYFDFSGNPIFDDNGEVGLGVILIRDVTQQVLSQNLIAKQKEQLQAVIENINEAIFIYDKDSKLYALNKLAKDYFPNENLKQYADGYSYTKFFYLDNTEIPKEEMPFTKVRNGQHVNNYKAKMVQGDTTRYINVSGRPVYQLDKSIGLSVISSRDITEDVNKERIIKEQQELILKKEREQIDALKSLIEMKDEFLSIISHEFKTPLNVINTAIQAMNYICGNELSEKGRKYLGMIKQNTFRQVRLVNNLLDITRANAGRIKINKKNIDIVFLTKAITESVYSYASNKGVKLTFTSSSKKKVIGIDDEKYERILLNLLSNAIKFTPEGKYLIVSLSSIRDKVCIKVKDTGIGIPPDKIEVIFERFGQVDSSLSRQAEGTGIGLSLVKKFIEALGGSISVKSKVGVGTTFTILLPNEKIVEEDNKEKMINLMDNRLIETTNIEFSDIYL